MNKPRLYSKSSALQRRDADYVIQNYFHHVDWRSDGGDVVLDVGCGTGDITAQLLLTGMPTTIKKLVGVDISKENIQYATETHTNPKLEFMILDVATKCLERDMEESFDHIVSFYCLHWIHDQRQVYQNMYKMLRSGGNLLFTFVPSHPIFDIYEKLSKNTRWAQYMTDVNKYVSPFRYSNSPENDLKKILEEVGFVVKIFVCENKKFTYESRLCWTNYIESLNPFMDRLPENLKNNYLEDFIFETKQMDLIEKNNGDKITTTYKVFIVCATKTNKLFKN